MGDFLFRTYKVITKKRWWALAGLLIFVAIMLSLIRQIQFDDDITALIPANEEAQRIQKVLKSIAFTDKIIINIRKGENGTVDDLTSYATELLDSIKINQGSFIKNIQGQVSSGDINKTMKLVQQNLPLFLDTSDYATIQRKLHKDSIVKITEKNYRTLISPTGIVAKKTILNDPLGLSFIALKKLQKLGVGDNFKLKNGFLLDSKEKNILLFITPKFGSNETNKNLPFADALYVIQNNLNSKYDKKSKSEYYGAALSAVANAKQIKHDIQFTVSIAMTLLIVFLILFYKKLTLPLILFAPTLFGGLLSITILCLLRDKISAISLGIGSVLLGVTLDYALHILTHIRNGNSIKSLYKEVAPSILMSSLTTASAFLCLLFLKSQALQDLGIFAAISVIGASIFALLFIPQVYSVKKAINAKRTFLDQWASYEFHKKKWALITLVVVLIISLFTYNKVIFNQDITTLNYETQVLLDARERLEKLTDIGSKSIYLSTYGSDREKVLQKNDSLYRTLKKLKHKGEIINFSSMGALAASNQTQQQKIDAWKAFWDIDKTRTLKQYLIESGNILGFKESTFSNFYKNLENDFKSLKIEDLKSMSSFPVNDYIVQDENGTTITSLIKVDEKNLAAIQKQFSEESNTLLINRQEVNEAFLGNLKNDFNNLLGYSLIVVLLILALFYRSISLTLLTSIPIFLTWFLTVGIMGLFHIEFNIFNIIICSFIFGLGVDYSIFVTNGLLAEYRTGKSTLSTNKTSIILSVITTMAGVGVLIFAKHPVLYTVSVVSLIGILCAAFVAFTLQPLLFKLFIGSKDKRPISLRYFIHSVSSFGYFGFIGLLLSLYAKIVMTISPKSKLKKNLGFHKVASKLMGSVLYTNPFLSKTIRNPHNETFEKPVIIIANHTSFLDILAIAMLNPKIIFLVNDWVYNSPIFGSAAKLAGAYPVSEGMENGGEYLQKKVLQGFSIIVFPEGTRSTSNKIKRFHKGAFYLAEQFNLDILPVLIHGNSEALPKGTFIIRDGSVTVEILPRIKANDSSFGKNYTERSKKISAYFKEEFNRLRNEIETETYWHKPLLENYVYKGDVVFKTVQKDVKTLQTDYKYILDVIGRKASIVHFSQDLGQLDILLALDSIDRKIMLYHENPETKKLLENHFLKRHYSKIKIASTKTETMDFPADVWIINIEHFNLQTIDKEKIDAIKLIILLKNGQSLPLDSFHQSGFITSHQNDNFILLKK